MPLASFFRKPKKQRTAAIRVQRTVQSSDGAVRDSARRRVRLISLPGAHEATRITIGRVRLTAAREDGACLLLYDGILEFWREIHALVDDENADDEWNLTGEVVRGEPANTFYIATRDLKYSSRGLVGTSHRLASSVTLSRHSAHGQENYRLRMLLKSWSEGTVDQFEEIGNLIGKFSLDEYLPFDLRIESQIRSSGSFECLSELWEFLVYVGAWH